jgi:hypothetical protein
MIATGQPTKRTTQDDRQRVVASGDSRRAVDGPTRRQADKTAWQSRSPDHTRTFVIVLSPAGRPQNSASAADADRPVMDGTRRDADATHADNI